MYFKIVYHLIIYYSHLGQNILLRSDIQREFCKTLRLLTEGKCGKIAEKCEPNENLQTFRYAHRLNVGEALNKFIFGNAQLYTNNFVNIDQCNQINDWHNEKNQDTPVDNVGNTIKGYSNIERRITPGVIQPQFSDVSQSKNSRTHSKPYISTHFTKQSHYPLYRIKTKRRRLFTKSPNQFNHTNAICNLVLRQYVSQDNSNIPSYCKNIISPGHFGRNIKQNSYETNVVEDSKSITILEPKNPTKIIGNRTITELIPFQNLTSTLLTTFESKNVSNDQNITLFYSLPIQNFTKPVLGYRNKTFVIRNNLTKYRKYGPTILDTSNDNSQEWILENNEIVTVEPVFIDKALQQPLRSKGVALNMTPFLRLGEMGIIIYQILYGSL